MCGRAINELITLALYQCRAVPLRIRPLHVLATFLHVCQIMTVNTLDAEVEEFVTCQVAIDHVGQELLVDGSAVHTVEHLR